MRVNRYVALLLVALFAWGGYAQNHSRRDSLLKAQQDRVKAQQDRADSARIAALERFENARKQQNDRYAKALAESWKRFDSMSPVEKPDEHDALPKDVLEKMKNPELMAEGVSIAGSETARVNFRGALLEVKKFFRNKIVKPMVEYRNERKGQSSSESKKEVQEKKKEVSKVSPFESKPRVSVVNATAADKPNAFTYYGTNMRVNMGDLPSRLKLVNLEPKTIANAWLLCSEDAYTELIQDCLELKDEYKLCDWAYLQMLKALSDEHLGKDSNESTFLTAYIFCQSGYKIRLGQTEGRLLMLYGSEQMVYNQPFFKMENMNLYPFGTNVKRMFTIQACEKAINDSEQPLSMLMTEEPVFDATDSKVRYIESDKYPEMKMQVKVNENLIKFFNDYPVSGLDANPISRWALYANTPLAEEVKNQIYPDLRKAMEGLSDVDKVRRLLSLLQPREYNKPGTSLQYELDDSIWGRDRAFFAEETLFYQYSDCEDHAILFSRLVRDLVKLPVMLVYYPGLHLAAAVKFNEPLEGNYQDRLVINDKDEYYICDPTNYIPEPGVTMEGMDNSTANAIMLEM